MLTTRVMMMLLIIPTEKHGNTTTKHSTSNTTMELNLPIYRQAIDDLLESIEPLKFHVQARKLAPTLTTKLFHLKKETLIREHQERCYQIIEAHERAGFRIMTPYGTRSRFDKVHPMKIFNTEEE